MEFNSTFKVLIGWILIFAGLLVVFFAIKTSYDYFTAKADFPALFAAIETAMPAKTTTGASPADQQAIAQQAINQAIANILPGGSVAKLLDIIAWSIFATFLVYAGAKLCGIGIQLLSPRNVS